MASGSTGWEVVTKSTLLIYGSILRSTFFMLYINDPPDVVIGNIAVYANDTSLH